MSKFYFFMMGVVKQVAQRGCGCPISESIHGQFRCGFEQLNLVKDAPAPGREVGLDHLTDSSQPKPFYDSVVYSSHWAFKTCIGITEIMTVIKTTQKKDEKMNVPHGRLRKTCIVLKKKLLKD